MSEPTWLNQLKEARKLPDTELRRHAAVARLEGSTRCFACFCCAAEAVLKERELADRRRAHDKPNRRAIEREEAFEASKYREDAEE